MHRGCGVHKPPCHLVHCGRDIGASRRNNTVPNRAFTVLPPTILPVRLRARHLHTHCPTCVLHGEQASSPTNSFASTLQPHLSICVTTFCPNTSALKSQPRSTNIHASRSGNRPTPNQPKPKPAEAEAAGERTEGWKSGGCSKQTIERMNGRRQRRRRQRRRRRQTTNDEQRTTNNDDGDANDDNDDDDDDDNE